MVASLVLSGWIGGVAIGYAGPIVAGAGGPSWPAPVSWLGVALCASGAVAVSLALGGRGRALVTVPMLALALSLGLARGAAAVHHPGQGTVDGYLGSSVRIAGTVETVSTPLAGAGGSTASQQQGFRLAAQYLESRGVRHHVDGLVLVSAKAQAQVWPGQQLSLAGSLTRLRRLGPGGVAGYADRLERQGVEAAMTPSSVVVLSPPPELSISRAVEVMRQGLARSLRDLLPEPEATLVLGEVAGIRGRLPAGLDSDLVDSGLVHILAISGSKVAIVAGMLQMLTVAIAGRRAALAAIGGIGVYTLVGGASASAVRSALMGSLALVGRSLRRDPEVLRSLMLAGCLMLAWRPSLVADLSFQYSFLGVLGIHLFAEPAGRRIQLVPSPLREALAVTLAAQVATLPLTAHYFQVIPMLAPVANALILPTLPASIASGLFLGFDGALARSVGLVDPFLGKVLGALEVLPGALVLWLARTAAVVAHVAAHVPGAVVRAPRFDLQPAIAYYSSIAVLVAGRRRWRTPAVMLAAAAAGVIALLILGRPDGHLHVSFLDAGGGPAALVVAPDGATLLIDGGSKSASLAAELDATLPASLPMPGRRHIDALVITGGGHAEAGGLVALDSFAVGAVVAPEGLVDGAAIQAVSAAARGGAPVTWVRPGDRWRWHGLDMSASSASSASLAIVIGFGADHLVVFESPSIETAGPPPGDYAVVDVGDGAAEPAMDGVGTRLVVSQDVAGKTVARAIRTAYGQDLWQISKDGRLDVGCDGRRCWW